MTSVLNQVQGLLDREIEGRKTFHSLVVFSDETLEDLQNTTEACLLIYLKMAITTTSDNRSEKAVDAFMEKRVVADRKNMGRHDILDLIPWTKTSF